jgi:hypothetical protein
MNIYAAYKGAVDGLKPCNSGHIRDLQFAVAITLAKWRCRGIVNDGEFVSDYDLQGLKPMKGKKELK